MEITPEATTELGIACSSVLHLQLSTEQHRTKQLCKSSPNAMPLSLKPLQVTFVATLLQFYRIMAPLKVRALHLCECRTIDQGSQLTSISRYRSQLKRDFLRPWELPDTLLCSLERQWHVETGCSSVRPPPKHRHLHQTCFTEYTQDCLCFPDCLLISAMFLQATAK